MMDEYLAASFVVVIALKEHILKSIKRAALLGYFDETWNFKPVIGFQN